MYTTEVFSIPNLGYMRNRYNERMSHRSGKQSLNARRKNGNNLIPECVDYLINDISSRVAGGLIQGKSQPYYYLVEPMNTINEFLETKGIAKGFKYFSVEQITRILDNVKTTLGPYYSSTGSK